MVVECFVFFVDGYVVWFDVEVVVEFFLVYLYC